MLALKGQLRHYTWININSILLPKYQNCSKNVFKHLPQAMPGVVAVTLAATVCFMFSTSLVKSWVSSFDSSTSAARIS